MLLVLLLALWLTVLHALLPAVVVDRPEEDESKSFLGPPWPSCRWWWWCWNRMERMRLCVVELELEVREEVPAGTAEEAGPWWAEWGSMVRIVAFCLDQPGRENDNEVPYLGGGGGSNRVR